MNGRCWARPFVWRKKELPTPPKPPGTRKYSSVTRIHFYKEALSTQRNWSGWLGRLADWLTDWLTDWESKQTDSYILLHTALKHWSAFWREGGGGGCGTLILSYISRFCPFLEIQNFELHFLLGVILGRLFWVNAVCFYTWFVSNVRQLYEADDFSRRHFQMHFFLAL